MNQTDMEKNLQADPELDAVLEQMSGEVPPMPADFHDKWMNAIRAEAAQNASAPEEKTEKKVVSLNRWTRILSIAAVFIFLIGGTALYRNSRGSLMPAADKTEAAVMADLASAAWEEAAEETAGEEPDIRKKNAATMTLAAGAPQAASEAEAPETWSEAAAYDAEPALAMGAASMETAETEYDAAEEPIPLPQATAMPTMPAAVPEEAETDTSEAEQTEEVPGLLRQAGEFITDMGDFLLAALPYLAVLAVPAVIAAVLRRRKKNG